MNILVISTDRLIGIKFPIQHKVWMSKRRIVAATTWIMTMTCVGSHESLAHTYKRRWAKHHIETISVLSFGTVMIIVHILLIKYILKKPDIVLEEAETKLSQKRSWEKKVILTCTLFVSTYIICTWPGCIALLKGDQFSVNFELQMLFIINSPIDPCLYFFKDYLRHYHKREWRSKKLPLIIG